MVRSSGTPYPESPSRRSRGRRRPGLRALFAAVLTGGMLLLGGGVAQAGSSPSDASESAATPGIQAVDYYEFRPRHSAGKCLDVANASVAHGTQVVQGNCWGGANQRWQQVDVGYGYFQLRPQHNSYMCLDVAHASLAHGASVVQGTCTAGRTNQHWRRVDLGNGFYEIRARHSEKCLDVAHASQAHGAYVVQGNCVGGYNQHWQRVYVGTWG